MAAVPTILGFLAFAACGTGPAYADSKVLVEDVRVEVAELMASLHVRTTNLALRRPAPTSTPIEHTALVAGLHAMSADLTLGDDADPLSEFRDTLYDASSLQLPRDAFGASDGVSALLAGEGRDMFQVSGGGLNWLVPGSVARLVLNAHYARGVAGDPMAKGNVAEAWGATHATDRAQLSLTLQARISF